MTRTLVWPDGTVYTIIRSSHETAGAELEMEWCLPARGWAPQPHVHPGLTQEYEVLEGSRVRNVHRPARDFEPYIQSLCRTANERGLGDLRSLRSLLYIAMLVDEYPEHSRAAGRLLNATASHIAALALLLRLRPA